MASQTKSKHSTRWTRARSNITGPLREPARIHGDVRDYRASLLRLEIDKADH